jgi:uncharacterized protein (DUF2141 family)
VIHGNVFVDVNGDGIHQTTEPGMPGVFVFVDLNGDGKYTPGPTAGTPGEPYATSGPNGNYEFHLANDGTYSVLEVVPPNFTMTTAAPVPVVLAGGANVAGPEFGNHPNNPPPPQVGYITGQVFLDANSNGKLDTNEHGMFGVRVYDDANGNGKYDVGERFTFSAKNGRYGLVLPAGQHSIQEVVPNGYTQTAGPGTVTIVAGQGLVDQDIGNASNAPFAPLGGVYVGSIANSGSIVFAGISVETPFQTGPLNNNNSPFPGGVLVDGG